MSRSAGDDCAEGGAPSLALLLAEAPRTVISQPEGAFEPFDHSGRRGALYR